MVPKGWKLTSLGEICNGNLQTGPFGSQLHAHEYVPVGIPVLMPKDLIGCRAKLADAAKINQKKAQELKKHFLKTGDLLFSRRGDVARFALIDEESEGSICGTGCLKARPSDKHSSAFLAYFLQKDSIRKWLEQNAVGQTMPNMNTEILNELPLMAASSKQEEDRIAQILSTWDNAISVTEKLLTNSQQQKKALMQQLLTGKKRLLDENGTRFSETWKLYALSELFQRVTTKNNGKSNNVVTISGQHGLIKQEDFFKKTVASDTLDGYFLLKKGQFAYNKSYSNGYPMGAIKRLNRYPEGVVTTLYICFELTTPKKSCGDYWEHYFESGLLNNSLSQIAHEGGRAHGLLNVKPSDFFSLKVAVPGFEEQQKIASVLSAADTEISTLEKKLACLRDEKKALMQQLLTGKRRVKVDEAVAV
ncbi:restriction endonuclease subunit S [Enterobacter hormaechei]|uniref:restriction endonuclease subunit S n=1 Tax=Enterobacter hormaechei TaxID=158836 RepID=UPI0007926B58|nr:restriction endonuclease subunit S [Enterobacter hormaechei]CZU44721.1 EcoKI restriction-modification system protein HsdS [Enterobacter hormaechei]